MKNLVKTLILTVILQIILQIVFVLPLFFIEGSPARSGSLSEAIISLLAFSASLFVSMIILNVKGKNINLGLFAVRLAAIYLAVGLLSFFLSGFSAVQVIGYPLCALAVAEAYRKIYSVDKVL